MSKALVILSAFTLILLPLAHGELYGAESPVTKVGAVEKNDKHMKERLEVRFRINKALIEAAERIVSESKDEEALKYLSMARAAAAESSRHYESGDYPFALEDLAESTRLATYSIILVNKEDESVREAIIKDAQLIGAEEEHERKEARIRKSIAEAETFIRTAEKLLTENEDPEAKKLLVEAEERLKSSRHALAGERYDAALSDLKKAYKLATGSVRKITNSQAELITFPRPDTEDEDELLAFEQKKNDTYMFVATRALKDDGKEAGRLLDAARVMSAEAADAIKKNDKRLAIDKLRASTALLEEALK